MNLEARDNMRNEPMTPPKCTPVLAAARYKRKVVHSLSYDCEKLVVVIQGEDSSFARVVFHEPMGFRVLDERDLCEFWNTYSEPNGWLYEVESGGWLELESKRQWFSSPSIYPELREYLLVDDTCISVMCARPPEIQESGADLQQNTLR